MRLKLKILRKINFKDFDFEEKDSEWQFLLLIVGCFSIDWFTDCGEWFLYIYWKNKYWRFSSVGYLSWKKKQ